MSEWSINVPLGAPDDRLDLAAMADATRDLPAEDAAVARQLALLAACDPEIHTYGDLRRKLDAAGADGRRQILDRAREGAGLPTTGQAEARVAFELANSGGGGAERDEQGRAYLACAADGCSSHPVNEVTGAQQPTNVRKWWCSAHRDQAAPGDMEPWRAGIRYSRTGSIEFGAEVEAAAERHRVEAELRRKRREATEARQRVDAERYAELEALAQERFRREHMAGGRP